MDRRTFVRGTVATMAAGVFGAAAASPLAWADAEKDERGANPAWLGEEPEVDDAQIASEMTADLLIVGAGCAGLAAGATAAELGLDFVICDSAGQVPETREYLAAVDTRSTLAAGEKVDRGKLLNEISRYSSGKCNHDLVRLWIDESAEMFEWVDAMMAPLGKEAVTMPPEEEGTGGTDYFVPNVDNGWEPAYASPMRNEVFAELIETAGHEILFDHELVRLVHDDGKVRGAIFQTEGGYVRILADHVLLACGGYAANPQMMQALQPDTVACITAASYNGYNRGMGIRCGMWAGAAKQNEPTPMIFDRGAVLPGVDAGYDTSDGKPRLPGMIYQLNIGSQPFMKVNRLGRRFANESTPYDNMLFATALQPGGVFCMVFDGNAQRDIVRFKTIGCASFTRTMMELGMPVDEFIEMDGGSEVVMRADSLDELADLLGFEGEAKAQFLATCDRYNELYDAQEDADYGKEAYRLSELRTPPFYGCWFGGSLLTTLDGLMIDASMRVLDANREPIEGLYAAGDCSGGFFATNYPEYIQGLAAGRSTLEGRQCVKKIARAMQGA